MPNNVPDFEEWDESMAEIDAEKMKEALRGMSIEYFLESTIINCQLVEVRAWALFSLEGRIRPGRKGRDYTHDLNEFLRRAVVECPDPGIKDWLQEEIDQRGGDR